MEAVQGFTVEKKEPDDLHAVLEPLLVRVDRHASAPRDIRVDKSEFRIGRARENDEIILDTSISRKHCTLRRDGSREWTIQDLSSSCTMINDVAIAPGVRQRISVGDIIQFSPDEHFRYVFTLTLKDKRNAEKQYQDNELRDTMLIREKEFTSKSENSLKNVQTDQPENPKQCQQEALKCNHVVCLNEELQKWEEALVTCKRENDRLEANSKDKTEQWNEQQQNEVTKIMEGIDYEETGIQEQLLSEEPLLVEKLKKSKDAPQRHETDEKILQTNSGKALVGNCVLVDLLEVNDDPQDNILDTIDLTHDGPLAPSASVTAKNTLDTISIIMDEQLTCGICSELFIEATTLNCKHTFCQYCINSWNKKRGECPMCRAPVTSKNGALVLDNFIEQMVENLPDGSKQKRKRTIEERRALERSMQGVKKKRKTTKKYA